MPLFMSYLWVTNSFDCSLGVFSNVIVNFADVLTQWTKLGGICCRLPNLKQSNFMPSTFQSQSPAGQLRFQESLQKR